MCGIFAYVQKGPFTKQDLALIDDYFYRIKHRGPDHTSCIIKEYDGYSVFLGFHRLAIIDTCEEANPLLSDNGVYLICNGEIYNYQHLIAKYKLPVKTKSDCEAILQLYNHYPQLWPKIIQEFDGVFAFVLFDSKNGIFYTGRDRFGVRPMFIGTGHNAMCLASEGKAIPFESAKPYQPGTFGELQFNLDDHQAKVCTSFKLIQKSWVPAGQYQNVSLKTSQEMIKLLFIEAVQKRLVSDRPIGFLVSGGLDSSLVAAVAHKLLNKRITTFSIGLEGSPDLIAARKVAQYLDSEHHEIIISTVDIINALEKVIYYNESYDVTTTRASIPMYLIAKYIRENTDIKVIFSGEGADELLGGYLYFHKAPSHDAFQTESHLLLQELYKYDLVRGDRTTSAWGLELRVPFLDAELCSFVSQLDPDHKIPRSDRIEKYIIRKAFDGYLPAEILYRQKEAFSDGIGYNSVSALKDHAAQSQASQVHLENVASPVSDEERLYYHLFSKDYKRHSGLHTQYYWMPKWHENVTDPSATVLDTHLNCRAN